MFLIIIPYEIRDDLEVDTVNHVEYVIIEVKFRKSSSFIICYVYRPPSAPTLWRQKFIEILKKIDEEDKETIILGDFNVNALKKDMQTVSIKTNNRVCDQTNLTNFIGSQIYTSSTDNVLKAGVIQVGISDHYPVFITLKLNIKIKKHGHDKITYRSGTKFQTRAL